MAKHLLLFLAAICIAMIGSVMITSANGELLVDRPSIKLDAEKDKSLEFSILVKAKQGQTNVTSSANALMEEHGYGVIPSSSINVKLANKNINSSGFTAMSYIVNVPADQRSGLYKGDIILVEPDGTITKIPIELSVKTDMDYVAAFWLILAGTFLGATWEGINKYRGEKGQANADKAQNQNTANAIKDVVNTNLHTNEKSLAKLEVLNEEFLGDKKNPYWAAPYQELNRDQFEQINKDLKMAENNRNLLQAGKDAEKKVQEAKARKPLFSTVLQVLAISLAAVLATTFVFNQFLQTNPFFSPELIQGKILAVSFGFAAYLSFENLLAQAKKTINPKPI